MRWAYSKSSERTERLQNIWRSRQPVTLNLQQPPFPTSPSRRSSAFMDDSTGFPPIRSVFDPLGELNQQSDPYEIPTSLYPPSGPGTPPFSHTGAPMYPKHESPDSPGATLRVVSYETAFSGAHSRGPSRIPSLSVSKAGSRSPSNSLTSPVAFTFPPDAYADAPLQQQELHGGNRGAFHPSMMQQFVADPSLYYNESNTFNSSNTAFPDGLHFDAITSHRPTMPRMASHHSDYATSHSTSAAYNTGVTDMLEYVNHDLASSRAAGDQDSSPLSAYNTAAATIGNLGNPTSYATFSYSS